MISARFRSFMSKPARMVLHTSWLEVGRADLPSFIGHQLVVLTPPGPGGAPHGPFNSCTRPVFSDAPQNMPEPLA